MMFGMLVDFLQEWEQAQVEKAQNSSWLGPLGVSNSRCSKPEPGWVQINVDASVDYSQQRTSLGWVMRDHKGNFLDQMDVGH